MKKLFSLVALLMCALIAVSCTKEKIMINPNKNGKYYNQQLTSITSIDQMGASAMSCTVTMTTNLSHTVVGGSNGMQYTFTGSNSGDTLNYQFIDANGGSIVFGDTLQFTSIIYKICGTWYHVRTNGFAVITHPQRNVTVINYTDCLLPLNGLNGSIHIKLRQ